MSEIINIKKIPMIYSIDPNYIAELRKTYTIKEISENTEVSMKTLSLILHKHENYDQIKKSFCNNYSKQSQCEKYHDEIINLLKENIKPMEISRRLNVNKDSLYNYIKKHNLK